MSGLNTFLGDDDAEPAPVEHDPPPPAPEPEARAPEPEPDTAPQPPRDEDDVPEDLAGVRRALVAERSKRRDYKGEADRLSGELAAVKAQIEAFTRQPPPQPVQTAPPPPPPPSEPMPNVLEDPEGFVRWNDRRVNAALTSQKVDQSEAYLKEKIGVDEYAKMLTDFQGMSQRNPLLIQTMLAQTNPAQWAFEQVRADRALKEIGTDPDAWKARVIAEERAKWEAERQGGGSPAPSRPLLPQSLTTARSAGARGMAPVQDDTPDTFDDILAPVVQAARAR